VSYRAFEIDETFLVAIDGIYGLLDPELDTLVTAIPADEDE
jgi:hypothetical protein